MQREKEDEESRRLEEMSEDEYDALTEQEKAEIDRKRLVIKKERLERYLFLNIRFYNFAVVAVFGKQNLEI